MKHARSKEEEMLRDNAEDLLNLDHSPNGRLLIHNIKVYVQTQCLGISPHQVRLMFAAVKNADSPIALQLVRPNVAYLGARQEKQPRNEGERLQIQAVFNFLDDMMEKVETPEQLTNFKHFMEALVAYHKLFSNK